MKEETLKEVYEKVRATTDAPVGVLSYFSLSAQRVDVNSVNVSFRDEEQALKAMGRVASEKGFYAFYHSEKGKAFYRKNCKAIMSGFRAMVLENAGYGTKIGKN